MGVMRYVGDGLKNLVANLGTARDKASGNYYATPYQTDADLLNAYRGAWLPRKIVDIPALDACRNWRAWNADGQEVSAIEAEENRLGLRQKVMEAMTKARLFGGAAIYIGTGDSDPSLPLRPESVSRGGIRHLTVLPRRVLQANEIDINPESEFYGKPSSYTMSSQAGQVTIHPSRLVLFVGSPHPDEELSTGLERGWGDSILTSIWDQVKQADGTSANIASLVFEAKVDVIRIPNLMNQLAGDEEFRTQLLERLQLAAIAKGINGALILDKEEEYDQKSASFASLTDILLAFMQLVSGAADIPITRLLGQSPGGLNASGDNDIRNYYDRIRAMQELTVQPALQVLDEALIRSALGSRPPTVFYNWRSLWQTTDKERADIGKITADSIKIIVDTGLIPDDVMTTVAVSMLTESGIAPGLEGAMKDWTAENPNGEELDTDELAAVTPKPGKEELTDAAPLTLYVRREVVNVAEIAAWASEQGITELAPDLHVTIAYSRQPVDWIKAGNAKELSEEGKDVLTISEGGPRVVEPLGSMSAVLLFASSQLSWRHEEIVRAGASHDYPDYMPHISLTKAPVDLRKIEPYRGRIVLGPEVFEEVKED